MFGPAYGHNIEPFINFFEKNEDVKLTFAYSNKNDFLDSSQRIKYVKYSSNPICLIRLALIIKKEYDLIWYHGGYDLNLLFLINKFKNRKTRLIINVWGEHIPRILLKDTTQSKKIFKYYNNANIIQCNWYGVQNILKNKFSEKKLPVLPWGLHRDFFNNSKNSLKSITEKFISSINTNNTNFFYPKSFTEASDHDSIVEAVKIMKDNGLNRFCVYFWSGNISRGNYEKLAIEKIKDYQLGDLIKMEKHSYLPFNDMRCIWEKMDCGLQISINDQLSTTLLEPLVLKKEIIATNIEPYQILDDKYETLKLNLIERNSLSIAQRMEEIINGKRTEVSVLESRKRIIEKEFNFEQNIQKMLDYYQTLLENKKIK
jgi:glycosyltransferase involved in cell wall biosynthesis